MAIVRYGNIPYWDPEMWRTENLLVLTVNLGCLGSGKASFWSVYWALWSLSESVLYRLSLVWWRRVLPIQSDSLSAKRQCDRGDRLHVVAFAHVRAVQDNFLHEPAVPADSWARACTLHSSSVLMFHRTKARVYVICWKALSENNDVFCTTDIMSSIITILLCANLTRSHLTG